MSHELRTPMNCVIGLADLVLGTELTDEQREHLALLRRSADSLLRLLDGLLDLSKIEAGHMPLEVAPFSLRELLHDAVQPLALEASERGLALDVRVAPSVPDALRGAAGSLRQIVVNLVANALKFTLRGSVMIEVDAELGVSEDVVLRCAVRDTGVGIPAERQQEIFEAFAQADRSPALRAGGTGLGLTICRQLLGLMDGRIEVTSVEGVGSTFLFTVPLAVEADGPYASLPLLESAVPGPARALRVLVAEDHPVSQRLVEALLTRAGHRVTVAANGQEALGALDHERFDLVLMDGHMPGMDGIEATRAIRRREQATSTDAGCRAPRRSIPIVALTARAMRGDKERFLAAGFDAYLGKPVDGAQLLHLVQAMVPSGAEDGAADRHPAPPLDMRRLLTFVRADRALGRRLVEDVVRTAPADIAQLREALANDDAPRVSRTVHRLQGALAQICAGPAADALARVPILFRAGAVRGVEAALEEVERRLAEIPAAIE